MTLHKAPIGAFFYGVTYRQRQASFSLIANRELRIATLTPSSVAFLGNGRAPTNRPSQNRY
jgi:hypothetical protein